MQAQLGQILDPKDQKRPKNPATTFEECGAKTEVWEQKQGTVQAPCTQHQLRVSQMPKLPLQPDLWTHPYPQPILGKNLPHLAYPCGSIGPNTAFSEFLVWPLINFYPLKKAKSLCQQQNQNPEKGPGLLCHICFLRSVSQPFAPDL